MCVTMVSVALLQSRSHFFYQISLEVLSSVEDKINADGAATKEASMSIADYGTYVRSPFWIAGLANHRVGDVFDSTVVNAFRIEERINFFSASADGNVTIDPALDIFNRCSSRV